MSGNPGFWSKGRNRAVVYGLGFILVLGSYMVGSPELRTTSQDSSKKTRLQASTSSKTEIQDVVPITNVKQQDSESRQTISPTTSVVARTTYPGLSNEAVSEDKDFNNFADTAGPNHVSDSKKLIPVNNQVNALQANEEDSSKDKKVSEVAKNNKKESVNKSNAFGGGAFHISSNQFSHSMERSTNYPEQSSEPIEQETKSKKSAPVVYYAAGGYSAEEICNQLTSTDPENEVLVFFDAYDQGQKKSQKNFFVFHIQDEVRLGDFFDRSKSGEAYVSSQNKISFNYQQVASNRLFTQFLGVPKSTSNQTYWKMYMLCKSDSCKGYDGSIAKAGEWVQIGLPDQQPVKNNDVYAFLFDRKPFPKIDCLN